MYQEMGIALPKEEYLGGHVNSILRKRALALRRYQRTRNDNLRHEKAPVPGKEKTTGKTPAERT
jgi:hypothetical protein